MRASDFYLWVLISNAIGCLFALQENEIGFMVMLMHLSHSYIDSSRYTGLSLASGNQSENRQLNLSRTEKECAHAKWLNYFVMERKVNTRNEIEGAIKGRESTRRKREKKSSICHGAGYWKPELYIISCNKYTYTYGHVRLSLGYVTRTIAQAHKHKVIHTQFTLIIAKRISNYIHELHLEKCA